MFARPTCPPANPPNPLPILVCSCKPEAADRTLCELLGRQLEYRLLVAGHDAAAGVVEREQTTAEALQATMPRLRCAKYQKSGGAVAEQ